VEIVAQLRGLDFQTPLSSPKTPLPPRSPPGYGEPETRKPETREVWTWEREAAIPRGEWSARLR